MSVKFVLRSLLTVVSFLWLNTTAQSGIHYEGETLAWFLGKDATSKELKDLKADYNCEMANELHYLSKGGLELILRGQTLNEIHLYKSSAVYGTFTGKLPKNLKFGVKPEDVRRLLGKPDISYNSGYCEYEYKDYVLSCWFDGGRLSQVSLSAKQL